MEGIPFFTSEAQKITEHLKQELMQLQTGRASSAIVDHLDVEVYGVKQPVKNIASVSIPDAKTISISPWDKSALAAIEKAIRNSSLGLNPNNNGESILLNLPPMTEERRKDLVKLVKSFGEDSKVAIRQARQKALDKIKAADLPEDQEKGEEKKLQQHVDEANKAIDELVSKKDQEIMKI